jgi:hypothetical protein
MPNISLPDSIVESIAIGNADSIGEQPAILSNLALGNQIFNTSLQQQIMLGQQQAMNQLMMATLARCISLITTSFPGSADSSKELVSALEALTKCFESSKKIVEPTNSVEKSVNSGDGRPRAPLSAEAVADGKPAKSAEPSKMAATLPPEVVEAVSIASLKSIAAQPAMLSNLAYANVVSNTNLSSQNAVANQQALNELGVSVVGKTVNVVSNLGPLEAKSAQEILTGNTMGELIANLKALIASFNAGKKETP